MRRPCPPVTTGGPGRSASRAPAAVGYLLAFALLARTLKSMSVGTAYAIWAGAGTAVIAAIGMVFLGESASALKILGVLLVTAGVVVLNLGGATH
ncbi:DMT family transporter [Streptomyces lydicus]|uniref:DMT family transporter n=1 Tax=Streptomyces lydicus TaxID=47763 RepID=UPI00331CD305